jgi:tetratricopeptide (TPR) repeat protein
VFPHPVHWAGFVLQGEIGPILALAPPAAPPPTADEAIDEAIASALDRIVNGLREAGVHFEAGRFDEAIAGAHIAIAAAEARTEPHALGPLVSALHLLACAHQRDRPHEALAAIERAIAILEATVARPGGARNWILLEAGLHQSAGTALRRLGQPLAGVGAQTRSQRILERAVAEHPDWTPAWETLAKTYMNKANAVAELGQLRAAIGLYDLSLEVWDRLAAGGDPSMRARGAKVRVLRAARLRELGDEDTAVAEARAGLAVLEAQRDTLVHPDFANLTSWAQQAFPLVKPS